MLILPELGQIRQRAGAKAGLSSMLISEMSSYDISFLHRENFRFCPRILERWKKFYFFEKLTASLSL